jgi:uroporphyrinogen III methyltransferase/synthase
MPLHGKTILTTRAAAHADDLAPRLRAFGAQVIECPAIEFKAPESWENVDRAIRAMDSYQWLLFTSANAVHAFIERVETLGAACRIPIAVVGPATAASLERWKLQAKLLPKDFRAEGLLDAFPKMMEGTRILFPRAESAREILPEELRRRGAVVDIVAVYRTVRGAGLEEIHAMLTREPVHCVVFTSPSTARFFAEAIGDPTPALRDVAVAVIGPVTRRAAEGLGFHPVIEPQRATAADLAEAIRDYFTIQR